MTSIPQKIDFASAASTTPHASMKFPLGLSIESPPFRPFPIGSVPQELLRSSKLLRDYTRANYPKWVNYKTTEEGTYKVTFPKEATKTRLALCNFNKLIGSRYPVHVLGYWDVANGERTYVTLQSSNQSATGVIACLGRWFYTHLDEWKPEVEYYGSWEMGREWLPIPSYAYAILRRLSSSIEGAFMNADLITRAMQEPQIVDIGYAPDPKMGPMYYYAFCSVWKKGRASCEPAGIPKFYIAMLPFELHASQYKFINTICDSTHRKQWMYIGAGRTYHMCKLLHFAADCMEWVHAYHSGKNIPNWDALVEFVAQRRSHYEPEIWDRRLDYCDQKGEFRNISEVYKGTWEHLQFDRKALSYMPHVDSWIDE